MEDSKLRLHASVLSIKEVSEKIETFRKEREALLNEFMSIQVAGKPADKPGEYSLPRAAN